MIARDHVERKEGKRGFWGGGFGTVTKKRGKGGSVSISHLTSKAHAREKGERKGRGKEERDVFVISILSFLSTALPCPVDGKKKERREAPLGVFYLSPHLSFYFSIPFRKGKRGEKKGGRGDAPFLVLFCSSYLLFMSEYFAHDQSK